MMSNAQPHPLRVDAPAPRSERPLRIVMVGHVDHGKSTLIGRLFHDTGSLPEGKLEAIQATCARRGVPFEWAFLMDALQSERDQNITIDSAQIWFRSALRPYVIIDAPGHKEFLKNMITGAASAEAAVLLVDAVEGVREQSRRHATLLSLLGIRQVVVAVNKLDLVGFQQSVFEGVKTELLDFLRQLDVTPAHVVPISARHGDNVAGRSEAMSWYDGPTILDALDGFAISEPPAHQALRLPVQDVYRFDARRILAGRIESGSVRVGDRLRFWPGGEEGTVRRLERWGSPCADSANAGESIGVILEDQRFVERGHVATHPEHPPRVTQHLRANVFWMGARPLAFGRDYKLKLATQEVVCRVVDIERVIDASSLEATDATQAVQKNDVAEVRLETRSPVCCDLASLHPTLGRFVIVDGWDVAGGGIVLGTERPAVATLTTWDDPPDAARELRLAARRAGAVVWIEADDLGAAETLADTLARGLERRQCRAYVLSAAELDTGLNADLQTDDDAERRRRLLFAADLLARAGVTAMIPSVGGAPGVLPRLVRIRIDGRASAFHEDRGTWIAPPPPAAAGYTLVDVAVLLNSVEARS